MCVYIHIYIYNIGGGGWASAWLLTRHMQISDMLIVFVLALEIFVAHTTEPQRGSLVSV